MHVWSISGHSFAIETGGLVRKLSGGLDRNDESARIPRPPETFLDLFGVRSLDEALAGDVYDFLEKGSNTSFVTALRWVNKAWRNSRAISASDRMVFLKTAIEALAGLQDANIRGEREEIGRRYLRARKQLGDVVLWTAPARNGRITYRNRKGLLAADSGTALDRLLAALADWRNTVMHDGDDSPEVIKILRRGWRGPFAGEPVSVVSRVLCDLLRLDLVEAGYRYAAYRDRELLQIIERVLGEHRETHDSGRP